MIESKFSKFCIVPTVDNNLISINKTKTSCFFKLQLEYQNLEEVLLRLGIEIIDLITLEKHVQDKMIHNFSKLNAVMLVKDLLTNEQISQRLVNLNSEERTILRISLGNLLSEVKYKSLDQFQELQRQIRQLPIFQTIEGNFHTLEWMTSNKYPLEMPPLNWTISHYSDSWIKYLNEDDEKFLVKVGVKSLSIHSCFLQTIDNVLVFSPSFSSFVV